MYRLKLAFKCRENDFIQGIEDMNDVWERVEAMKNSQSKYLCEDYFNQKLSERLSINEECRARMCEWCYQTVDYFKLSRENVHVAMSCLDRFLSTVQGKPFLLKKTLYQLSCVASLYIAIKVNETVSLGLSMLVQLGRGVYTAEEITKAEYEILLAIKWAVNPPPATTFVHLFASMLPFNIESDTRQDILDLACYQSELAVADYKLSALTNSSIIAIASILNSVELLVECPKALTSIFLHNAAGLAGHLTDIELARKHLVGLLQAIDESVRISPQQKVPDKCKFSENTIIFNRTIQICHTKSKGQEMSPIAIIHN